MRTKIGGITGIVAAGIVLTGCSAAAGEPEQVPITQLEAGDCFDTDEAFTTALVYADCSPPHLYEAFHLEILEGEPFPGDEAVSQRASEVCDAQFQTFTGVPVSQSTQFASMFLGPTEESWMTEDDRTIVCLVMPLDGQASEGSAAAMP